MKPLILFLALGMAELPSAAKEFANLNFDEGGIPPSPISELQPIELVLPGWTARMGDHVLLQVGWNAIFPENGIVSVLPKFNVPLFEGRYGMTLIGGAELGSSAPIVPASISQVGLIPADARSLIFNAAISVVTDFEVRLDGQSMPLVYLSGPPTKPVYGVDIGVFAGRETELRLIDYVRPGSSIGGSVFDSLRFSIQVVPEPSTWALFGVGFTMLCWIQRRWK